MWSAPFASMTTLSSLSPIIFRLLLKAISLLLEPVYNPLAKCIVA
jgi:hypothetical protein